MPHFSKQEESEPTEEFIAWNFKTQWCPIGGPHEWESCVYAHTYRDWRRTPAIGYSSWPCTSWQQSVATGQSELMYELRCSLGMACPLAHGAKEQLYHPQFYKTSPCSESTCRRGPLCAFTHGEWDTRGPPPQSGAEDAATRAAQGAIPWAAEILAQYQPLYWNPPRYHALEDQVGKPHRGGGQANRTAREASALQQPPGQPPFERRHPRCQSQPTVPKQRGRLDREARAYRGPQRGTQRIPQGEASQLHWSSGARDAQVFNQPFFFSMPTTYSDQHADSVEVPFGLNAPMMWTHQGPYLGTVLTATGCDASERSSPLSPLRPGGCAGEASPLSAAIAALSAFGSPMAVPLSTSGGVGVPAIWTARSTCSTGGLEGLTSGFGVSSNVRERRFGQGFRTPSSFGSPRGFSMTPTETTPSPRLEEGATGSSQEYSSSAGSAKVTAAAVVELIPADLAAAVEQLAVQVQDGR